MEVHFLVPDSVAEVDLFGRLHRLDHAHLDQECHVHHHAPGENAPVWPC
jgi:hypothetical protein